jgi:hypothetical protein
MKLRVLRDHEGRIIATSEVTISDLRIEPEPDVEEGQRMEEIEVERRQATDLQFLYKGNEQG